MNIVKGVADLLRRSSGGVQTGEGSSWTRAEKLSAPSFKILFEEVGEESELRALWQSYDSIINKTEKRKSLQTFLTRFIQIYENWEPVHNDQLPVDLATLYTTSEHASGLKNVVIGCSFGHPSEIILILVQEIARMNSLISELNVISSPTSPEFSESSLSSTFDAEAFDILNSLTIITRSMHNCRVFSYYGGVQKVTALIKAVVIQLKTLISAQAIDNDFSGLNAVKIELLEKILLYVVSIILSFIDLNPDFHEKIHFIITSKCCIPEDRPFQKSLHIYKGQVSEARIHWQRKAIILVMESGGVNWLVELLRIVKKLNLEDQWIRWSLQYLILNSLRCILFQNPRAQNHFRSIGGLEVLLDGLSLPSSNYLALSSSFVSKTRRGEDHLIATFQLQILSLEVLKESIFGNLTNLQFLCENGRVQKFANCICSSVFMLQEYRMSLPKPDSDTAISSSKIETFQETSSTSPVIFSNCGFGSDWTEYCIQLSQTLCSFLLSNEDVNIHNVETSVAHSSIQVTFAYWELSIKWFLKVLVAVFPCIKACSSENELPVHSRILANSLQHCTLNTLRKFLISAPKLLEVFREEGIWNFIFSEKFFYFWPVLEGWSTKNDINREDFAKLCEFSSNSTYLKDQLNYNEAIIPQMEIISFLEFAATLGGSAHNLPECSILLDTLEQSAYNPILSIVLLKSLHRILQLSVEQTVTSFKEVDAIGRVLKVSCIQAQEHQKLGSLCIKTQKQCTSAFELLEHQISCCTETGTEWVECMEISMELFSAYLSFSENAKGLVLHSTTCIDCLFDLFWEEHLRSQVLDHVLGLMKLPPSSPEDQAAMLLLCSKYLETFTHAKEKGNGSTEISIDLLIGMRDVLVLDQKYYQALFREGECFLHIVSLLNDTPDEKLGEPLVSNVLQTLTFLLVDNDVSKSAFRALAGAGYQTLQSLLLDFCQSQPSLALLNALLDMLVDGKFNNVDPPLIKNEDVIMLFLAILKKSSDSLRHYGLDILESFVKDSITNRTICFKSGALGFLLDWFPVEENDNILSKLAHLVWTIGGHSISGKDIRKIFSLLCSEKIGSSQKYCSLLLICIHSMLMEKGPTAFFELSGHNSGIEIKTPLQWPNSKGFSFSCWIRIESLPETGLMSLFLFCSDNGKGSLAMLGKGKLVFESIGQKRQSVSLSLNLLPKRWHCLCITHSIGRAFSGGSLLRCYVDGGLVSSEKCRYAKIPDALTRCLIGSKIKLFTEQIAEMSLDECLPFFGQIGPVYLFNDALSPEQVKGLYFLGPSYMYSFVGNEVPHISENSLTNMLLDTKDGLSSKVIFGLNAQASDGRILFNVSSTAESMSDKNQFEALVLDGTRLCSRRIFKEIIYCVGGVSVFFPLLSQLGSDDLPSPEEDDFTLIRSMMSDKLSGEVIELVTSVLDENLANQQQMHLLSGFPILGFLFQSITPELLNMKTLSSLKHLLHVIRSGGLSELLLKDAISWIYLNPRIWMYADYEVQRELYMFLIQHFENDVIHLTTLCQLPRIIDIICEFYWDIPDSPLAFGTTSLLHPVTRQVIAERPTAEEVRKIRLLLLSLAEMSLKQKIEKSDVKALIAFFERSRDMVCIEDVLQMVMRALSQNVLLASFLEQVNLLGGCHVFINLLQRELEPIRLLGLQFLGKLLVGLPSGKKGQKIFNLSVGRSKSLSENSKKNGLMRLQPIILAIADRLFRFPLSDHLCASLFDTLLGGASPKQILQKNAVRNRNKSSSSENCSHFLLPQFLVLIFNFLERCKDTSSREKMLKDLLDLLDSNPTNIEALVENCWLSWLETSVRLDILTNCEEAQSEGQAFASKHGHYLVRNVYCMVLSHYIYSVRGGWQRLEEAINFILLQTEKIKNKCCLVRNIFQDLVGSLLNVSSEENVFSSQPCRDNTLYLLKLTDEMLSGEIDEEVLFPYCALYADFPLDPSQSEDQKDIQCSLQKILNEKDPEKLSSATWSSKPREIVIDEEWWSLYDSIWVLICEMNGKGPTSKILSKASGLTGPSFGQRARGLVESLNIPAAEMAAAVVSGGIGSALSGKATKPVDKAMLLRGEKCPRIVFRLLMLYICRATLDRASKCAQQFISLLPCLLTSDDEQNKNKLHHYIWYLLLVKSQCKIHDDSSRLQIVSHLVLELVNYGKPMLTTVLGKDNPSDCGRLVMEYGSICNLIQKDRILVAANDEAKYLKASKHDRSKQLQELRVRTNEISVEQSSQKMLLEDETQSNVNMILASDDNRKAAHRLAYDENQQTVAEKWIHLFRTLIDERGPWSAAAFPNNVMVHWKHDKTEDICRRRPKLRKNYHFNAELCRPPTSTSSKDGSSDVNDGYSGNMNFPEKMKHLLLKGVRGIADELASDLCEDVNDPVGIKTFDLGCRLDNQFSSHLEYKDQAGNHQERKSLASSNADTDSSEVLLHIPCVLVTLKRKVAGHLSVMQSVLHFSGDFLVEGTGGSSIFKRFDVLQNSEFDQTRGSNKHKMHDEPLNLYRSGKGGPDNIHVTISQRKRKKIKRHRRWNITKVKAVHLIRYLLQYTAIEIFFSNSVAPVFLNFASTKDAKKAGDLVVSARNEALLPKGISRDKSGVISFVDQRAAVEQAEIARESWRRREISNFEYLIILNTLAGRTYNDLTQYPVFPWVLADYTSEKLDFNKSSTFRDLSKPVGALDSKRFEVFEERYRNFCDPDIPSFYYGSHYSSMGIVLFYLLRLEPFTALHRNLQGGKFDHADRLFQSIEGTYNNCLSNTSDVKELIPEFFYMPEFLVNMNSYHLGVKQDGEPLADVSLPPWAKGSPEEFIYRNREALESEYVSSNLHHWIDLIFGYKQRGKPAIEAANVFYHLTYEGAVDLEALDDELQRSAIEDQIANFGQTPIQIFRKKHPRRGPPIPIAHPLYFAPASISLTSVVSNTARPPSSILFIDLLDSNIVIVNQDLTLTVKTWLTTQLQSGGNFTFSSSQEPSFGIGFDILPSRKIGTPLAEHVELNGQCFATLQTTNENYLISCGCWDNSFRLISLSDGRVVQSIRQHKDVVSCIAVTSDGSVLATGSYDTTVMVWDSRLRNMEKRVRSAQIDTFSKDLVIIENPCHILSGHDDIITCLFASVELDIIISGSKDGTCMFHTLREGRYVRSIQHPSGTPLSKLIVSQHGRVVVYAENDLSLHMFSINGKHLAFSECNGRLNCIKLSSCGDFLVSAGDHGHIILRSMHSLDVVRRYEGIGKAIASLTVTPEECFLAGTKDGTLLVYSIENPHLRRSTVSQIRS